MKTQTALLLAALSVPMAHAGDPLRVGLDGSRQVTAPAAEAGKDGIDRIHKVEQPQLIVFPAAQKPSHGTIMVNPGGGYGILAVNHEGTDIAALLNADGWDVAVLLYRVSEGPKTRELALEDAKKGFALIQQHGGELGLNTNRLGVMGFSAGGHLTARLAHETAAAARPPDLVVLMYPAYLEKDGKLLDEVIPGKAPAFVYVAANDPYKPSSVAYDAYCREHNQPCEYHLAPSGGHGFGIKKPLPEGVADWPEKLAAFLNGPGAK